MKDPAVLSGIYMIQSIIHPNRCYIGSVQNIIVYLYSNNTQQ